jgi:hypothetical protein
MRFDKPQWHDGPAGVEVFGDLEFLAQAIVARVGLAGRVRCEGK